MPGWQITLIAAIAAILAAATRDAARLGHTAKRHTSAPAL
jgi:hypothetical protein